MYGLWRHFGPPWPDGREDFWKCHPTRREVAKEPPKWLYPVLIDWMWESPSELIPNSVQIAEVKSVLLARPDAADPAVVQIIAECDEYLACGT